MALFPANGGGGLITHKVVAKTVSVNGGGCAIYIDTSDLDNGKTLVGANIGNWSSNDAILVMPKNFTYNTDGHLLKISCYCINSPSGAWGWVSSATITINVDIWQMG